MSLSELIFSDDYCYTKMLADFFMLYKYLFSSLDLSGNFWWLRSANNVKFTESMLCLVKKCVQMGWVWKKNSPWTGNTLTLQLKKKFQAQWLIKKVLLAFFWDVKVSITIYFFEKSVTINSASYCQSVKQNSPHLLNDLCVNEQKYIMFIDWWRKNISRQSVIKKQSNWMWIFFKFKNSEFTWRQATYITKWWYLGFKFNHYQFSVPSCLWILAKEYCISAAISIFNRIISVQGLVSQTQNYLKSKICM